MNNDQSFKLEAFRQLAEEISKCNRCILSKKRKNPVVGDGDINAKIVLIGEAPGYWEDVAGKPFVGSAGKLLNELLREADLPRESIYITNVIKCRPPGNRDPHPDEVDACRVYLDRQLDIIRPRVIVTLGRHSTAYIFSKAGVPFKSISDVQGKVFTVEFWEAKTYIIPSYHPAAALYNARLKDDIRSVIMLVGKIKADLQL
ncbi:uracil-DNA glycosylase [Candidatus Bathyarchaeota archaeon]|nr:uracil-DNA glycosylase [Candidatus Bathyarchaeota archaeon]